MDLGLEQVSQQLSTATSSTNVQFNQVLAMIHQSNTSITALAREVAQKASNSTVASIAQRVDWAMNGLLPRAPPQFSLVSAAQSTSFALRYATVTSVGSPINVTVEYRLANSTSGRWMSMTFTNPSNGASLVITRLQAETRYAVRYFATSVFGRGPYQANLTMVTTAPNAPVGEAFSCTAAWSRECGRNSICTLCSVTINLPWPAVVYAGYTGHARTNAGWLYGAVYVNGRFDNGQNMRNQPREYAMGHTYTTQWENFHTARTTNTLPAGRHTISAAIYCSSASNCWMNGFGLSGFYVRDTGADVITQRCGHSQWGMRYGQNRHLCDLRFQVARPSLVAATFTGHNRMDSGAAYMIASFDNDGNNRQSTQTFLPAHSYTRQWECFGSHRTKVLGTGTHVTTAISNNAPGFINGAGLSHVVFPAEPAYANRQTFRAAPRGWSHSTAGARQILSVTIDLPFDAVVHAEFTGHYRVSSGWCYAMIGFDGDGVRMLTQMPSGWQRYGAAHGYNTYGWENFNAHRTQKLPRGRHTVQLAFRGSSRCYFNGMGLDGLWFRAATPLN